jgi:hypothetical protein
MVALTLTGVVCGTVYLLLRNNQRLYREQAQRIELSDNLRAAMAIVPIDLRELDAGDAAGSDIIAMTDSSLTYKAMRNLYLTCAATAGRTLHLDTAMLGLRPLDPEFDSLLVFADSQPTLTQDDHWIHVNVTAVTKDTGCHGQSGLRVSVSPAIQAAESVLAGYPVRGFEVAEVRRYADGLGAEWLGARRYSKSSGWSAIQPFAGPLEDRGLRLAYYGRDGSATQDPSLVARVSVTIMGRSPQRVQLRGGGWRSLVDTAIAQVALRNNP